MSQSRKEEIMAFSSDQRLDAAKSDVDDAIFILKENLLNDYPAQANAYIIEVYESHANNPKFATLTDVAKNSSLPILVARYPDLLVTIYQTVGLKTIYEAQCKAQGIVPQLPPAPVIEEKKSHPDTAIAQAIINLIQATPDLYHEHFFSKTILPKLTETLNKINNSSENVIIQDEYRPIAELFYEEAMRKRSVRDGALHYKLLGDFIKNFCKSTALDEFRAIRATETITSKTASIGPHQVSHRPGLYVSPKKAVNPAQQTPATRPAKKT